MQKMNENLVRITELLSDCQYHDGTSIGNQLNITRAAVWKAIKKLEHYDIPLTSVKGKGYMLQEPLVLLDYKKIKSHLSNQSIHLELLEKVDSTNEYLKKFTNHNKKIIACAAEVQTQGRGRRLNRQWHSPFGRNLCLSLLYPFQKDMRELSGLSLVVGLAVCNAIESTCQLNKSICVKWPNDVFVNRKKLAGILIEIQSESHGFCNAIIGIGVNVNIQNATEKQINQEWSSLQKLSSQYQDRNYLCAALINHVLDYLERFTQSGLNNFINEWEKRDKFFNQPIQLACNKKIFSGTGAGINYQGHLLLKLPNGTEQAFSSGDASILK